MKIIVFHGTKGSPAINWFPWLAAKAVKFGHEIVIPQMPTPQGQNVDEWLKRVPPYDSDTVMIGHSIGATFLLHVLENANTPVAKSIFVSPVMHEIGFEEYDELNFSFYDHPFHWKDIRANGGEMTIFHGNDDPYVPLSHAQELQRAIGGNLRIIPGGGHLNSEFGYTEFPELWDEVKK